MAYGDFKDLTRRTAFDKDWETKHLILLKIQNMMPTKRVLVQWLVNSLIKKVLVVLLNMSNKESGEELLKPIIKKNGKRKVYSSFKYNISWYAINK